MIELIKRTPELWLDDKITIARNQFLVVPGKVDTNTYFIHSGAIRVFLPSEMEEHTLRFGYQNSIITPLNSFLENKPNPFYFQAIRKTTVSIMPKSRLEKFIEKNQEGLSQYQKLLEQLVIQQMEREIDILTSSPAERLKRVLKRSPQLFQEIPFKYIAAYLRMTPETLSRIYKS